MARQRVGGFPWPIVHDDWQHLLDRYLDGPPLVRASGVTEVVRSIVESPARTDLRYATSMWELIVAPAPGSPAPVDAVIVSTPNHPDVLVAHLPLVGRADQVERPADQKEKYGIEGRPDP